jgi:bleomycin hydrolase
VKNIINLRFKHALLGAGLLVTAIIAEAQNSGPFKFKVVKNLEATEVKSQDNTGTCWSFSATSFLESEILRKSGKKFDLSEIYVVRKIYLDKAENYLRFHGKANFSQGALAHDQLRAMKQYGLMPEEIYSGKKPGGRHNHNELEKILKNYLDSILKKDIIEPHWKEGFEALLDKHLGQYSPVFTYNNVIYSPVSFAASLGINPDDYQGFTSYTHHPYYESFALEIPDNYSRGYYTNLPLEQLIELIDASLDQGYTVEWDGDVSEPGFARNNAAALLLRPGQIVGDSIPVEDVPTQELRQATFDSHETTDDHLMHITGIAKDQKGNKYYITKNSWGKSAGIDGYVYMSENYVKLKTVSIFINKKTIPPVIQHFLEKH